MYIYIYNLNIHLRAHNNWNNNTLPHAAAPPNSPTHLWPSPKSSVSSLNASSWSVTARASSRRFGAAAESLFWMATYKTS